MSYLPWVLHRDALFEGIVNSYQKKTKTNLLGPADIQGKLPLPTLHEFIKHNPTNWDRKALAGYIGERLKALADNLCTTASSDNYSPVISFLKAKSDLFEG